MYRKVRLGRRGWLATLGVLAAVCATANVALRTTNGPSSAAGQLRRPLYQSILGPYEGTPDEPGYPAEWRVADIAAAQAAVDFTLIVPDHPVANAGNVSGSFVLPGEAIALDFPPPEKSTQYVRQEYIEVYEATWVEDMTPQEALEFDIKNAPSPEKELIDISGTPALTVEARSTKDDERANPAFLKFVFNGVEVQISGGEDLQLLIEIAKSMMAQAAVA